MRKESPMKGTARYELPALSPQHERADYSRRILRINEVIRSILSISHMERMDLIAINNRSLCNHSKVKRAERATRRPHASNNLPNLKEIRLDTRRRTILRTLKPHSSSPHPDPHRSRSPDQAETELCQIYIEEYLDKLKQEKRFDILADRGKLIEEACRVIIARMEAEKKKSARGGVGGGGGGGGVATGGGGGVALGVSNGGSLQSVDLQVREVRLPMNSRKARSITEIEYSSELSRIRRSSEYSSKARALNEKMFLRKIRQIKLHSLPE